MSWDKIRNELQKYNGDESKMNNNHINSKNLASSTHTNKSS